MTKNCFLSMFLGLAVVLAASGQIAAAQNGSTEDTPVTQRPEVGLLLDRFLDRAKAAAAAADVIKEADVRRRASAAALKAGRRDEALEQLRRAGEIIAAAAPDADEKHDDPFLRQYLAEITAEIVALSAPANIADQPIEIGDSNFVNPRVAESLKYYSGRGRSRLTAGLVRLAQYRPMMARIFREEGVPEWLLAIGLVESSYNTSALSPKQALGIWQFIPETGSRYGLQRTALIDERRDPEKSTRAAARYLRDLYALFGDWPLAIAAYNTGENRVARVMQRTGARDFWTMAAGGLLPAETINYVPAVLAASRFIVPSDEETKLTAIKFRR